MAKLNIRSLDSLDIAGKLKIFKLHVSENNGDAVSSAVYFSDSEPTDDFSASTTQENKFSFYDLKTSELIHNVYDAKDIWFKSAIYTDVSENRSGTSQDFYNSYAPSLSSSDIGVAVLKDYAYCLTPLLSKGHYFPEYDYNVILPLSDYSMSSYESGISAFLYNSLAFILSDKLSAQLKASVGGTDDWSYEGVPFSYSGYLSNAFYYNPALISDIIQVQQCLSGIPCNYLYEVHGGIQQPYDDCTVIANSFKAKNFYNSLYSMQISSLEKTTPAELSVLNCRRYDGIGKCGSSIFLKYHDNQNFHALGYDPLLSTGYEYLAKEDRSIGNLSCGPAFPEEQNPKLDYQHIEVLKSVTRHSGHEAKKSNLYSITVDSPVVKALSKTSVQAVLKQEIKNSIRLMAKHICPANTQLYDVFFTE
jgi:hypothetical protein